MAGENLKAFDQLRETTAWSLSQKEKADLNAINQDDIRAAKSKIESKTFTINGSPYTLNFIVDNLEIAKGWERATFLWKEIGRGSELWAAIQLFAIAHNKSIGPAAIDGKVWRWTVRWLEIAQTDIKAEWKAKEALSQWEKIWIKDLATHVFTKEFNTLNSSSTKKFKDMGLLSSDGYLNFWIYTGNSVVDSKWNCTLKYTSNVDKTQKSVTIHINKDVNDKVDCLALARDIKKQVEAHEGKLYKGKKESSVISWIDKYDVSKAKFTAKVMSYLNETSIIFKNTFNKDKLKLESDWTLSFWNRKEEGFFLIKNTVDSFYNNWKFNSVKFNNYVNNTLSSFLEGRANHYYANELRNKIKDLKKSKLAVNSIDSVSKKIAKVESQINRVQALWVPIPADVKKDLNYRKELLENAKNYKKISKLLDDTFSVYEKKPLSLDDVKSFRSKMTNLVTSLEKHTLTLENKNVYNVYLKMENWEKKYQSLITRAKKIRDKVV